MGILIVNPNPIFDRTISIVELVPGAVIRTLDVELTAGGKGINVARVLRALGRPAPLLIPVGVDDLPRYADLLTREGAQFATVSVPGGVRTASIYLEQAHDRVTVVNDAGSPMSPADWSRVCGEVRGLIGADDLVLCMGSFPPGLGPEALEELIDTVHARGARILIDTAPQWLAAALGHHPDAVTPNLDEAEAALHAGAAHVMDSHSLEPELIRPRAESAARELVARGAVRAFVTGGAAGVAMAHGDEVTWLPAFPVRAVSTVGAGDSFVAGLAAQWGDGDTADRAVDWDRALRTGVAAAAASVEVVRAGGADAGRIEQILAAMSAEQVAS
jgi:1-phosphofructokinase family hexose kinase